MMMTPLTAQRKNRFKISYTARRANPDHFHMILSGELTPHVGDFVVGRVQDLGQHGRLELTNGRRAQLFPGDEVVVCYGNRYAPDQFEAEIPHDLSPCHLVAAGGIASRVITQHVNMEPATTLEIVGLLCDSYFKRINLSSYSLTQHGFKQTRPTTIAVLGTSMNAGKTTTAAHLIYGLTRAGKSVGAAKVTGTGAGGDIWKMTDAGAKIALDFTHAGVPSTYKASLPDLHRILQTLMSHLIDHEVDVIVLEVADGLFQQETSNLVSSNLFRSCIDGVLFASSGALGALAGATSVES
jgi:hypothetical protein